jgi:hypothetical protein
MTISPDIISPEKISTIKKLMSKTDLFSSPALQKPLQAGCIKLGVIEKIAGAL